MDQMFRQEGYELIGAAMAVYNEMGSGYLESVYQECLQREFIMNAIPFESQPSLTMHYKGQQLKKHFRPDLLVFGEIITELKAMKTLGNAEVAQLLNYLKVTGKKVGYLINFGSEEKLDWKRFVL